MVGISTEAWAGACRIFVWSHCIMIPLSLWKLVDIAVWLYRHVNISVGLTP